MFRKAQQIQHPRYEEPMASYTDKSTTKDSMVSLSQRNAVCADGSSTSSHRFEAWSLQETAYWKYTIGDESIFSDRLARMILT